MAKLNIKGFEEIVLYPDTDVKHYHVDIELTSANGEAHECHVTLSRDKQGYFHWGSSDAVVEQLDDKWECALSNAVFSYAYKEIK